MAYKTFNCFCINGECSEKFKNIEVNGTDEEIDSFVCDECGGKLKVVGIKTYGGLLRFESLSDTDKKRMIKKRSMDHFKKTDKGDLANYKKKIIEDNKRMTRGEL